MTTVYIVGNGTGSWYPPSVVDFKESLAMPLPVSPTNTRDAYERLREAALNTRSYFSGVREEIASGTVDAAFFLGAIATALNTLRLVQEISGNATMANAIIAYVKQQVGDDTLDVHTELAASMAALAGALEAMVAAYPKDADGFLLDRRFDQNGALTWMTLTPSDLSGVDDAVANWLATIV